MDILHKTRAFVKDVLSSAEGGHDWFHIERVTSNALTIAASMPCNPLVVELAALLHDIADSKFHDGDEEIGPLKAESFLQDEGFDSTLTGHIIAIIRNVSYKGGLHKATHESIELDIVMDADRLDAIGAIGIARTFNYGGFKNRALYDPDIPPQQYTDKEQYKHSKAPTINHFYEKLLLLKDLMRTEKGREMAEQRHEYMEGFLEQFYAEWAGKR